MRRPNPGGRLRTQEAGKAETAKPQGSDPEEAAAGQAVRDNGHGSSQVAAGRHWQPREVGNGGSRSEPAPDAVWCAAQWAVRY